MTSTWRGTNFEPFVFPPYTEEALNLHLNIARYQIAVIDADITPPINWGAQEWIDYTRSHLSYIDSSVLPLLPGKARLVIDMHHPPGWFLPNGRAALFSTKPWGRDCLIQIWQEIATRYKDNPTVLLYDILNEPAGSPANVNALNHDILCEIRKIDKKKRVTVSSPFGEPTRFDELEPLDDKFIWYQTHFYYPFKFTGGENPNYPTATWNKQFLKEKLEQVRLFQKQNDARIFVGEFGAFNSIPDATRSAWYRDCISLFEKYSWHWAFHAWTHNDPWRVVPDYPLTLGSITSKWALNKRT